MNPTWLLAILVGAAPLPSQGGAAPDTKRVEGTVRDEQGQAIAGAVVQIIPCSRTASPLVLAIELLDAPLPSTRSAANGAWSLLLSPNHQRFDVDLQGSFALVVEAPGFQPWRELLPSPLSLYDGSDVVLPRRQASDDARIVVADAPPGAIVRLQRRLDHEGTTVLDRVKEWSDLAVPADGQLVVNVPLLPCPLVLASNDRGAFAGWTAQLLAPGRTTACVGIEAGQSLRLVPAAAQPSKPAKSNTGDALPVSRLLVELPDGAVRWFPTTGDGVPDDPRLPVVAVQLGENADARLVAWTQPLVVPATGAAPTRLRVIGPDGAPIRDAILDWCAPEALASFAGVGLRPHRVVHRQRVATGETSFDPTTRTPCAWISAPGHLPRFVLDVRGLPSIDGTATIQLDRVERELTVMARDDLGTPLAGAVVCVFHRVGDDPRKTFRNGPLLAADGSLPRTDADGSCRVPMTAKWADAVVQLPGHRCHCEAVDAANRTMTVTCHRQTAWQVRAVNKAQTPQPFVNLGCSIMTPMEGGGSMGTDVTVCTDSRGRATLLTDTSDGKPPQLAAGMLGSFAERGTPLQSRAMTTLEVETQPLVVVRLPANPSPSTRSLLRWRRRMPGLPLGNEMAAIPHDGAHWWFRWPSTLDVWMHDAPNDPPVVITTDDVKAPRVDIDGGKTARLVPLRLEGVIPNDLTTLRVVPKTIRGLATGDVLPLGGEYLAKDRTTLRLQTSDMLEHTVALLHPELVPVTLTIARGDVAGAEVTAKTERGAPCTLVLPPAEPCPPGLRVFLTLLSGRRKLAAVELFAPQLYTETARTGMEVASPFALPIGKFELLLSRGGSCKVEVTDNKPVRAEFSPR